MPTDPATVPTLTPEWCVETYYRVNPGSTAFPHIPSLYLLDFAREVAALAASRVDTAEVERRAARKALAECAAWLGKGESQPVRFDEDGRFLLAFERVNAFSDRYIAREYPAPAPRECVLSDGSVVTRHDDPRHVWGGWWRRAERDATDSTGWTGTRTWPELMRSSDTGADFDALKRFAAEVGR